VIDEKASPRGRPARLAAVEPIEPAYVMRSAPARRTAAGAWYEQRDDAE
jgi:hypothetical protein